MATEKKELEQGSWRYAETQLAAEVQAGNIVLRPHWKGTMSPDEIRNVMRLASVAPAMYEALQKIRAMFFEDALSGANVVDGKLEHVDNDLHPWIPGARAPQALTLIDSAIALVNKPREESNQ